MLNSSNTNSGSSDFNVDGDLGAGFSEESYLVGSKRKFLKTTGVLVGGSILGAGAVDASLFGYSSKPVAGIPKSWVDQKGTDVYRYANYILSLRLRFITPYMVIAPHFKRRRNVTNSLPPKSKWKMIGPTLKVIDRLAREMGAPVKEILSVYRSPSYNWAVRGKSKSLHMVNQAVDVTFRGVSPYYAARVARYMRDKKRNFEGGVGDYRGFIHVDTRGYNADW